MSCTAFNGARRIASGDLQEVAMRAKAAMDGDKWAQVLIFDDTTGGPIDVDFRRMPGAEEPRQPGRPKLGVVAREVTLLPRHWEWLANQPGGASVALRKLVEQAKRANHETDRRRETREAAYRFLSAMAGNEPEFEEATRALFAGKRKKFEEHTERWPRDIRDYARRLAAPTFTVAG
jgi:uncharacterized protein